jgi:hypothetical protein
VARDLIDEQRIFELGSPTTVVHDHRTAGWCDLVGHDRDMRCGGAVLGAIVGHDVAWLVVFGEVGEPQRVPVPRKEASNDLDPTMVDIAVSGATPGLLDQYLQINAELSVRPNHDIGANTEE